jgi:hypothetical protein
MTSIDPNPHPPQWPPPYMPMALRRGAILFSAGAGIAGFTGRAMLAAVLATGAAVLLVIDEAFSR